MNAIALRNIVLVMLGFALAACSGTTATKSVGEYGAIREGHIVIPPVDAKYLKEPNRRKNVELVTNEAPGTIIVDPHAKFLYFVEPGGTATRYPIAVGREGRGFNGEATVGRKADWPGWTPTPNMLRTEPQFYAPFAKGIPGGVASPLGARALYLYRGNRDTYFRIHGTNDLSTIGNSGSAGCIRMFNQDVIHLEARTAVGAKVRVRTYEQSVAAEGYDLANRGIELPPPVVDPEAVYAMVAEEERRRAEFRIDQRGVR